MEEKLELISSEERGPDFNDKKIIQMKDISSLLLYININ